MQQFIIGSKEISDIYRRTHNNDLISDFLRRKAERAYSFESSRFWNRAGSVVDCGRKWWLNYYRLQSVKVVNAISCCKDRFCPNCQNNLAERRLQKYLPFFRVYQEKYAFQNAHVVLTVPNCDQDNLAETIDRLFAAYARLIKYFRGKKKIRGIDFERWSFRGAVRGLEITRAPDGKFHPHIHSIWSFGQFADFGDRCYVNKFSYDRGNRREVRRFSFFEIFLQKLWRMCYDRQSRVTLRAINDMSEGYSCTMDLTGEDGYHEVFKYTIKGCFSKHGDFLYDFKTFDILDKVLYYYDVNFEVDEIDSLSIKSEVEEELRKVENPVTCFESLDEVERQVAKIRYISVTKILDFYRLYEKQDDLRLIACDLLKTMQISQSVNYG